MSFTSPGESSSYRNLSLAVQMKRSLDEPARNGLMKTVLVSLDLEGCAPCRCHIHRLGKLEDRQMLKCSGNVDNVSTVSSNRRGTNLRGCSYLYNQQECQRAIHVSPPTVE